MGLNRDKVAQADEKCLRVIMSCKDVKQYVIALKYLFLMDKSFSVDADTAEDKEFLRSLINHRKGFIMGILWVKQGRDYVLFS